MCEKENEQLKFKISEAKNDAIKVSIDRQALYAKLDVCESETNEVLKVKNYSPMILWLMI